MAADVSSLVRILSKYKDDQTVVKDTVEQRSTVPLLTRNLLGSSGSCGGGGGGGRGGEDDPSLELDLDFKVPKGFEKRLDLKTGKIIVQKCNSKISSSSSHQHHHHHQANQSNQKVLKFQDLNFPPITAKTPTKPLLNLFEDDSHDTSLELKLVSSSISPPSSFSVSSSVCTLDKVKSALERVEKNTKKRQSPYDDTAASSPVAVGCPVCLSYVFVEKNDPKCPRCHSIVLLPVVKKPKIDLNISI